MFDPIEFQSWQRRTIALLSGRSAATATITNVTAVSHHLYRDPVLFDTRFDQVKAAFLMTRLTCGTIPCVLVVNRVTHAVEQFCDAHAIKIDCDPSLPGGITCLSMDCIQNLHARFDTDYMLCIHGDGFPLRSGLDAFVGKYDYIGAPWGPASWYTNLLFPYPKYCVGNGGFSLRSKRLCEMAASCYRSKYRRIPYCYALIDDVYYCKVLPRFEQACRKTMAYAPPEVAGRFSFESNLAFYPKDGQMPFGFHSANGFARVMTDFCDRINAQFL
jgi:hypothetical protein